MIESKILMCGSDPNCRSGYNLNELIIVEREISEALRPLADFYGRLSLCIDAEIYSARAAYGQLCKDATEKYNGVVQFRDHVIDRMKLDKYLGEDDDQYEKKEYEMERDTRILEGFGKFANGCIKWNLENPSSKVSVVEDPFIVYR